MDASSRNAIAVLPLLVFALSAPDECQSRIIQEITYEEVESLATYRIDFEAYAGELIDDVLVVDGARIGETFAGQTMIAKSDMRIRRHDILDIRTIETPLRAVAGRPGRNLAVLWDDRLSSYGLSPIGPDGMRHENDFGTGMISIQFDEPQCYFGLRVPLDNMNLSTVTRDYFEGNLNVIFYNKSGDVIGDFRRFLDQGRVSIGYMQTGGGTPEIAGVTIQNLDPGGIAIDDLIFDPTCPYLLF